LAGRNAFGTRSTARPGAHTARGAEQHRARNRRHSGPDGADDLAVRVCSLVGPPESDLVGKRRDQAVAAQRAKARGQDLDGDAVFEINRLGGVPLDQRP
jgi:hypothetical protein